MGEPFLGEMKIVSFNYAPRGWAACDGQLLPINQNQALFSLLGTSFGGNGQTNFALPDMRGRLAQHFGDGYIIGQNGGEVAHTLSLQEMPMHVHVAQGTSNAGTTPIPQGMTFANPGANAYATQNPPQPLTPTTITSTGGSQAHDNMSPYLVVMFIIALQGIFPSPN